MEVGPDGHRFFRLSPTTGWTLYAAGWGLWSLSLVLPLDRWTNYAYNPPLHGTIDVFVLLMAPLTGLDLTNCVSVWWRLLAAGYYGGLVAAAVFPVGRRRVRPRWAVMWALGTCAGLLTPWVVFAMPQVVPHRVPLVGTQMFAIAHLIICVGIWLLVPPLSPNEKFTHRLRRWLREL